MVLDYNDPIVIQGAGPSGLTAAITLARGGRRVHVFERKMECGMRFRGDFQGFENWSSQRDIFEGLQSMGLRLDFWYQPVRSADFYDCNRRKRTIEFEKPALYLIRRGPFEGCLDLSLKQQALDVGVKMFFQSKISEEKADIIAGGPCRADGIVRGMVFETTTERIPTIILDDRLAPKSFAYLLTGEGMGCLGTGLISDFQKADTYLDKTKEAFQNILDLDIRHPRRFTGFGNFGIAESYVQDGRLCIGEAAGLQDYLLAFGLRQAITSGYLAAQSMLSNRSYDELIKNRFYGQLKTSVSNRFLFQLAGNRGYARFLQRGRKIADPIQRMYRQYNPSFFKKAIFPLARWRCKI